jgi:hypothetical protein
VSLPAPGAGVSVDEIGRVVRGQDLGTRRAVHYIELEGESWVMPLPSGILS